MVIHPSGNSIKMVILPSEEERLDKRRLLSEDDSSGAENHVHLERHGWRPRSWNYVILAANVAILLMSLVVNFSTWSGRHEMNCVMGSDLHDARKSIEYEQRIYTGALIYDSEAKRVFRKQDASKEYFGQPSQDIDNAWEELLHGMRPTEFRSLQAVH